MELSSNLVDAVKKGKAVLLFGSGALYGAKFPPGKKLLLGDDLKDALCDNFLSGKFKNENLQYVAELAESATNLFAVQEFVASQFEGIEPAQFHRDITLFNWRALFTTNYDLLIEDSYRTAKKAVQACRPILSNFDPLDEIRRTDDQVPLYKLHGCISQRRDERLPFILTVDQYNEYLKNRNRLFKELYELAFENTIVFVGHSLKDANLREIIRRVEKEIGKGRPRYYLLKPGVQPEEVEHWNTRKITAMDCTLEDFINALVAVTDEKDRVLSFVSTPSKHPLESKIVDHRVLRDELRSFLVNEVEYVDASLLNGAGTPEKFYRGFGQEWYPIIEDLDTPRTLCGKMLTDVIGLPESDRTDTGDLYVVKGEAGSGKSVLLRRLAWEAGVNNARACFYLSNLSSPSVDRFEELFHLVQERLFIFVDNAANSVSSLSKIVRAARQRQIPITVITAERYTEWYERCQELDELLAGKFKLPYLGQEEIEGLVKRLELHNCLGEELAPLTHKQRVERFEKAFDRQLLVALHEVTLGKTFEDIIYDEYRSLSSETAKALYRTVCILNRHRVPVRAGLIHRVFGIDWSEFSEKFLRPLEKVVIASGTPDRDLHYSARHPEIAEIVFQRAYDSVQDRYHEYVRILKALNISYQSDRISFRNMIRAKTLQELFQSLGDVQQIYDAVLESVGRDPYVLQQMANYERIRDNGNLRRAIDYLNEAHDQSPRDGSILHTLATVWRDRAAKEPNGAEREQYRREARAVLDEILKMDGHTPYVDSGFIELAIADVRDALESDTLPERVVDELIRRAEKVIADSRSRFPSEGHLPVLEAEFAGILADKPRALAALQTANRQDPSDPFVAIRLSAVYLKIDKGEQAEKVLSRALESRRTDHRLNFAYAQLLREYSDASPKRLAYFYRRAFTPGDKNYEAQFWFARFAIESDDREDRESATEVFGSLRRAKVPHRVKTQIRDYYGGVSKPSRMRGRLVSRRGAYGFVEVPRFNQPLFLHEDSIADGLWELFDVGIEIECAVGFNYTGLACVDVELL